MQLSNAMQTRRSRRKNDFHAARSAPPPFHSEPYGLRNINNNNRPKVQLIDRCRGSLLEKLKGLQKSQILRQSLEPKNLSSDFEILEFYGDSFLYERISFFIMQTRRFMNPGMLTELRMNVIKNQNLARCYDTLNLGSLLTPSEYPQEVKEKADIVEAIIGELAEACNKQKYAEQVNQIRGVLDELITYIAFTGEEAYFANKALKSGQTAIATPAAGAAPSPARPSYSASASKAHHAKRHGKSVSSLKRPMSVVATATVPSGSTSASASSGSGGPMEVEQLQENSMQIGDGEPTPQQVLSEPVTRVLWREDTDGKTKRAAVRTLSEVEADIFNSLGGSAPLSEMEMMSVSPPAANDITKFLTGQTPTIIGRDTSRVRVPDERMNAAPLSSLSRATATATASVVQVKSGANNNASVGSSSTRKKNPPTDRKKKQQKPSRQATSPASLTSHQLSGGNVTTTPKVVTGTGTGDSLYLCSKTSAVCGRSISEFGLPAVQPSTSLFT